MKLIEVIGKITEMDEGSKQISYNKAYNYIRVDVTSLKTKRKYSIFIDHNKVEQYGFMPRVGLLILVRGTLFKATDEMFNPTIKYLTIFKHISEKDVKKR